MRQWNVAVWAMTLASASGAIAQDYSLPGPYAAGWRSVTVTRPNSSTFTARLYYPGTTPGQNAPLNGAGAPYSAVSFGHGFLQTVDRYQSTLAHMATWGIVVIASDSEGGLFPSHSNFALDMRQCLTYLEQQNAATGSLLFQAVATDRFGMSGHSMGGGCSILAAAADVRVKALANLAAAETNPSAIAQMPNVSAAVSLISGSSDTVVPVGSNGQLMFNAGRAPKLLPVIQGGWHCGFEDVSTFGCDSGPMVRADQLAITRRLLVSFFTLYLRGDQQAWGQVWGPARDADPRVVTSASSGIAVSPASAAIGGFQFRTAQVGVTVTNAGPVAAGFTLLAEDSSWGVQFDPAQTGVLGPGGAEPVVVSVQIPGGFLPAIDDLLVTARSNADGSTRGYMRLSASRFCYADLDRSGFLTANDFQTYINAYAAQSPDADGDGSGVLTANDFLAFLNAFAGGC